MADALRLLRAVVHRDLRLARRRPWLLALDVLATFLSLALFHYVAQLISPGRFAATSSSAPSFFGYAVVGLANVRLITAGLTAPPTRVLAAHRSGALEWSATTRVGAVGATVLDPAYDLLRAALVAGCALVLAVAAFGVDLRASPASLGTALAATAAIALFAWAAGTAVAAVALRVKSVTVVVGLLGTVLALLAGVYFPGDLLPRPIDEVAAALPLTGALDAVRGGVLRGEARVGETAVSLACAAVTMALAVVLVHAAMRRARASGELAGR